MAEHKVAEAVEEVVAVVRAGGGLGVVLNAEGRNVEGVEPLHHVVVEVDVAHLNSPETGRGFDDLADRCINRETVVVGGNLHPTGCSVDHWLVDSAVPERQLVGREPEGPPEELVAEADPKEWQAFAQDSLQEFDVGIRCSRIPGAIREKSTNRLERQNVGESGRLRQDVNLKAAVGEVVESGPFDAKVKHCEVAEALAVGFNNIRALR